MGTVATLVLEETEAPMAKQNVGPLGELYRTHIFDNSSPDPPPPAPGRQ